MIASLPHFVRALGLRVRRCLVLLLLPSALLVDFGAWIFPRFGVLRARPLRCTLLVTCLLWSSVLLLAIFVSGGLPCLGGRCGGKALVRVSNQTFPLANNSINASTLVAAKTPADSVADLPILSKTIVIHGTALSAVKGCLDAAIVLLVSVAILVRSILSIVINMPYVFLFLWLVG